MISLAKPESATLRKQRSVCKPLVGRLLVFTHSLGSLGEFFARWFLEKMIALLTGKDYLIWKLFTIMSKSGFTLS